MAPSCMFLMDDEYFQGLVSSWSWFGRVRAEAAAVGRQQLRLKKKKKTLPKLWKKREMRLNRELLLPS